MNLHGIASGAIAAVNPLVTVQVAVSTGSTTGADGTPTPTYAPLQAATAEIQPMTWQDLRQVEGLNLNGTRRSIYLFGEIDGIVRDQSKGGDLITFPDGSVWLVALVLEQWPDWCKVAATRQDGS